MEISRLRNRHCFPFLKAGRIFLRANSFTVSGLMSKNHSDLLAVEQLLFSLQHGLSLNKPPLIVVKKFFLSNKFTLGCQGNEL